MKINKIYKSKETIIEMSNFYYENEFLQLNNFFENDLLNLTSSIKKEKFLKVFSPLSKRLEILQFKDIKNFEIIKFIEFFKSKEFLEYIEEITQLNLNLKSIELTKLKQGDYIIINDKIKPKNNIEIYFDLTKNWDKSFGGVLTWTSYDEEKFYLEPKFNTLSIIYNSQEYFKYLKYINCLSNKKSILRINLILEIIEY